MTLKESDKDILIQHRINQSKEALENVQFLLENKKLSLASNRIYYAIFYIISAVAIKNDFSTSKHKQLLGWFNKNYIATNKISNNYSKIIYEAYSNREKSDYDFLFELTLDEINHLYENVKEFVEIIIKKILLN